MRIGDKIRWISGAKSVKLLTDFPLLVKYVRERPPCDLWLVIKSICEFCGWRGFDRWSKKVIFRELNEMTTTSKWFHTKLCVQVATNQPFCNIREGTKGLESDRWEKKGLAKPWLMAKYGTKGSMFHFIQPLTKNVENHQLFGS